MTEVFLDTSYAIALSVPKDSLHTKAVELARWIKAERLRLVTTQAVLLEIGDALSKTPYRRGAISLIKSIQMDPSVIILPLTTLLCKAAFALFRQRPDKDWGLTDCVSFVVMQERGLSEALTADDHFRQAGYRALLLESPSAKP